MSLGKLRAVLFKMMVIKELKDASEVFPALCQERYPELGIHYKETEHSVTTEQPELRHSQRRLVGGEFSLKENII